MKKLLLVVPVMFALAACGGSGEPTSSGTTTGTSTSQPSTSTEPPAPTVTDVTVEITVSGIDVYDSYHSTVWMTSEALGTMTNWGTYAMTQSTTNENVWSIVIPNYELGQSFEYGLCYGTESSPMWSVGANTEGNRFIDTEEGKTTYAQTATFKVGSSMQSTDIIINPTVRPTSSTTEALNAETYVYAWIDFAFDTVKFEKQSDDSWKYTLELPVIDGKTYAMLTPVLGLESGPMWDCQFGAYSGTTWETWSGTTFDDFSAPLEISFQQQPDAANAYTLTITYTETPNGAWSEGRWLRYSATETTLAALGDDSKSSFACDFTWTEGNTYTATYVFTSENVNLAIGLWVSSANRFVGSTTENGFAVSFSDHTASFTVSLELTEVVSTYAGVVTNATGCTVA